MKVFFKPEKEARTPYLDARGSFNEMYGTYVKAAKQWKMAAAGCLGVALITSGGLVAVSLQHKVVPYAVEFNEHGEAMRISRADEMEQPNQNQTRAGVRNWLIGARTVYVDRRAQNNLMGASYAMTLPNSSAYKSLLHFHTEERNPYETAEKATVEVVVNTVRPISDKTWLVEWTETTKQLTGLVLDSRILQGTFTVAFVPPIDESQILANPIGLYVEQFSWGQRQ